MTTPHPGFERSSPDEDGELTSVSSDQTTRAHQSHQTTARHHHRNNAVTMAVSDLPALHIPPLQTLPLTPTESQCAVESASSAPTTQPDFITPTFTLTTPHDITEAVLPCFEEDTPLLRSVTPESESQLVNGDGPSVGAENDNERPGEHEDEVCETEKSPGIPASDQAQNPPASASLTIVGRDEHGDEYKLKFVHIPVYIFEHSAPGERSGAGCDVVVDLYHGGEKDADTDASDSDDDLDSVHDAGSSSDDSDTDIDAVFSDAGIGSGDSDTDVDTLFSDDSSTSTTDNEDPETDQDAGRFASDEDETDIVIAYQGDVPVMFTLFSIESDEEGHGQDVTQADTRQLLHILGNKCESTAISYPKLSRTMTDPDGLLLHEELGGLMGRGLTVDERRPSCAECSSMPIALQNDTVPLLMHEVTRSEHVQASNPDHPPSASRSTTHDHETAGSSCPTVQWMNAFTEIVGVDRHLPRPVHQLRDEWPGRLDVDMGSVLVGRDWVEWRIVRRRASSLLRQCVEAEGSGQDEERE